MRIRHEKPSDITAIHNVLVTAFPTEAEANLVRSLRNAERLVTSLVAELESSIVGHIVFSSVAIEAKPAGRGVGLAPVAVHPSVQRQGVGSQLIRDGLRACKNSTQTFCVVLGEPAYYMRFGFRSAAQWKLENEYGAGDEFMAIELVPDALASIQGLVRYAPEFADLDSEA